MSLTGEMSHERGIRSELPPEWPRRGLPLTLQAFNRPENQRSVRTSRNVNDGRPLTTSNALRLTWSVSSAEVLQPSQSPERLQASVRVGGKVPEQSAEASSSPSLVCELRGRERKT
ncbi:hypothetical protein F2P81_024606 [Scophthalmus maximus]|uniref:Uncharacterized protein n=1 Tax=Scophthalmus maximus TaxID=52904 RepID=A0A6A4RN74_SCOMX|nr:hypothetical protein F2P81_024606 [Scophthalmus maximus]